MSSSQIYQTLKDSEPYEEGSIMLSGTKSFSAWDFSCNRSLRTSNVTLDPCNRKKVKAWDFLYSGPHDHTYVLQALHTAQKYFEIKENGDLRSIKSLMGTSFGCTKSNVLKNLVDTLNDSDREAKLLQRWAVKHNRVTNFNFENITTDITEFEKTRNRLAACDLQTHQCFLESRGMGVEDIVEQTLGVPENIATSDQSPTLDPRDSLWSVNSESYVKDELRETLIGHDAEEDISAALEMWTEEIMRVRRNMLPGVISALKEENADQSKSEEKFDMLQGINADLDEDWMLEGSSHTTPQIAHASLVVDLKESDVEGSVEVASGQESNQDTTETTHPLLRPLQTLVNIVQEFVSTEENFVADIGKLKLFLAELRFSVLGGVKSFVASASYVGVYTSTEAICISNSQFLMGLKKGVDDCVKFKGDTVSELLTYVSALCSNLFKTINRFTPFFALFSQFIVNHDGFSLHYSTLSFEDPSFSAFLSTCERALGETLLSLVIKPVQRLPRYVLLCKEIHAVISKARKRLETLGDNEVDEMEGVGGSSGAKEMLDTLVDHSRSVHASLSDCAKECNNAIRAFQDNARLHDLYRMFVDGGTDLKASEFLTRDRKIIKEGVLKRHHKHGGIRSHEIQLFSDALYSSSQSGKGLKLEQRISLMTGSDTQCVTIPSSSVYSESAWFVVISKYKTLFLCGRSHDDMNRWVAAIQSCLHENNADSDYYLSNNHIALANTMIGEINRRLDELDIPSPGVASTGTTSDDPARIMCRYILQTRWWQLVDALESVSSLDTLQIDEDSEDGMPRHNLRKVVEMHVLEVASRIAQTIHCQEDSSTIMGGNTVVENILLDDRYHYLIAMGVFFEYSNRVMEASSSVDSGERPAIVRLFLFHDLLIGTIVDSNKEALVYYFHIFVKNLECSGGGPATILLVDKASQPAVRRKSIFDRQSTGSFGAIPTKKQTSSTKILCAPNAEIKSEWLSLLANLIDDSRQISGKKKPTRLQGKEYLLSIRLERVTQDRRKVGSPTWTVQMPK